MGVTSPYAVLRKTVISVAPIIDGQEMIRMSLSYKVEDFGDSRGSRILLRNDIFLCAEIEVKFKDISKSVELD